MENYFSKEDRAQVLVDALPHIKKYTGKTVVIKYGGHAMISQELRQQVMEDIVLLHLVGVRVVIVHGGGTEITEMMEKLGKKSEFKNGLRVTDNETVDIVQMVLAGKINKGLVNLLGIKGGRAIGLSGMDAGLIKAKTLDPALGFVGEVTEIDKSPIEDLLDKGYIPVISTLGCDEEGNIYNINGDTAAAFIAGALGAEAFILMTDVPGVLMDAKDPNTLIAHLKISETKKLKEDGIISEGMIPKIECCETALKNGAEHVVIMDGRVPHSILMELLTYDGAGTYIEKD